MCDFETVESVNSDLYSNLSELVRMPFFKYFQVCLIRNLALILIPMISLTPRSTCIGSALSGRIMAPVVIRDVLLQRSMRWAALILASNIRLKAFLAKSDVPEIWRANILSKVEVSSIERVSLPDPRKHPKLTPFSDINYLVATIGTLTFVSLTIIQVGRAQPLSSCSTA